MLEYIFVYEDGTRLEDLDTSGESVLYSKEFLDPILLQTEDDFRSHSIIGVKRYTKYQLRSIFQLMGCKQHHSFVLTDYVFDVLQKAMEERFMIPNHRTNQTHCSVLHGSQLHLRIHQIAPEETPIFATRTHADPSTMLLDHPRVDSFRGFPVRRYVPRTKIRQALQTSFSPYSDERKSDNSIVSEQGLSSANEGPHEDELSRSPGSSFPRKPLQNTSRDSVHFTKKQFLIFMHASLKSMNYTAKEQLLDFCIAREIKDRKRSITVLFGGTSGCGKSTLASLFASRLGVTTVVSTDSIRHMLRNFGKDKENPLLWSSTYNSGEALSRVGKDVTGTPDEMIVKGYEAQNQLVYDQIEAIITSCEARNESVVVEGVHLSPLFMVRLMERHSSCIPFIVFISNETKHRERFAVRAKYMTLDAHQNKYIKYFKNIRIIQRYICNLAELHQIPRVDNTNVDRSVATIQATVFDCVKSQCQGGQLFDGRSLKAEVVHRIYEEHHQVWSSKKMLNVIHKKGVRERDGERRVKFVIQDGPRDSEEQRDDVENQSDHTSDDPSHRRPRLEESQGTTDKDTTSGGEDEKSDMQTDNDDDDDEEHSKRYAQGNAFESSPRPLTLAMPFSFTRDNGSL
eukprot:TRINITY_DN10170_c0_g1_i1.p1 TRINITY_DN10170_c0_g1~~TRINITY_DN10170_c0_g1_i1.p1  ORF type:complete len:626 (+),score=116.57 TRINITY_DN10170_c0_g1_i1:48-1925(+)